MSYCRCRARLNAEGACPYGCPPKWKRRPGLKSHEGVKQKREEMLNAATVREAFNANIHDNPTEFFTRRRNLNKRA